MQSRWRGQALAEFALTLPIVLMVLVGAWVWNDALYRIERVQFAAGEAARAAATGGSPATTAGETAQAALRPTFDPAVVGVTVAGADPCQPGDQLKVTVTVPWDLLAIPFWGQVTVPIEAVRFTTCEPPI